jgi:hypothetical protein
VKIKRLVGVLGFIAILFAVSIYFSSKKLRESKFEKEKVIVVDAPTPEPSAPLPQKRAATNEGDDSISPSSIRGCKGDPIFKSLRQDLGKIINDGKNRDDTFLQIINQFSQKRGLPLPISVDSKKFKKDNIVMNECRPTCQGNVFQIFVTQIIKSRSIEVLTQDGSFKKLPLHDSGLEVASIDELNVKGIPFRSWLAPVSDSDWYIKDTDLYYSLDIPELWLKINPRSQWEVVRRPKDLLKLQKVDEPLKVPGCNSEEQCLEGGGRHFKAPQLCRKDH